MIRKSFLTGTTPTRQTDLSLLKKVSNKVPTQKVMRGNNITNLIEEIKIKVNKYLGEYANHVKSCRTEEELSSYIDVCIKNGIVALDTETTGLDCLEDLVVGTCLYTPNELAIYIPHKHKSYITGQYLQNQISYEFMREQLQRLIDAGVKFIYHNAKFDMRIVNHCIGISLPYFWDTMIAARLMNNLEKVSLKEQYAKHIKHSTKTYDFEKLFAGIEYAKTPVDTATLYAATDPLITYELYKYQEQEFEKYPKVYNVFRDIELPVLPIVIKMEDVGVALDFDKASELSVKYHKLQKDAEKEVYAEIDKYKPQILSYKSKIPNNKLSEPINIGSPIQLGILLYDIIQVGIVDKKKPRGTDEEILTKIKLPLCEKILNYREIAKLLNTYIDKLPKVIDKDDKRIHASFNQLGAATGRFSSTDPNLQNIPSKNMEIRTMFKATEDVCEQEECENNVFSVSVYDDVKTPQGFVNAGELKSGDTICGESGKFKIISINNVDKRVDICVKEEVIL